MQIFDIWTLVPSTSPERGGIGQIFAVLSHSLPQDPAGRPLGVQRVAQDLWHTHSTCDKTSQGTLAPFHGQKVALWPLIALGRPTLDVIWPMTATNGQCEVWKVTQNPCATCPHQLGHVGTH